MEGDESSDERPKGLKPTFFRFFGRLPKLAQRSIKSLLPFAFLIIIALLPLGIEPTIQYALAVFVCVAMLWTFGSFPLAVTALLVPVLLTFFGIFRAAEALEPFADPVVYLLMGGLIIAEAFRRNGLDKRLAYYLISIMGGEMRRVLLALMLTAAFLSMWISNTAAVALLIPVAFGIASKAGEDKAKMSLLFLLGIGIASVFGGMATITGSPPNAITSGLLARETVWTFFDWMKIGVPLSVLLLGMLYWVLPRIMKVERRSIDISAIREELKTLGPLKPGEKKTLLVFFPTVALWILGSEIASSLGFSEGFMSAAIVALSSAFLLFAIKALDWNDAKNISWEVFLIVGAGLALGEGLQASGAAEWMADIIANSIGAYGIPVMMLVVAIFCVVLTNFMSNTATAAVMVPILIGVSSSLGLDPKFLVLVTGFAVGISFITPIGTPPITLIYSTGSVTRRDLARTGLIIGVPATLAVVALVFLSVNFGLV